MRLLSSLLLLLLICTVINSCQDSQQSLSRRWVITDLQTPSYKALSKAFDASATDVFSAALKKKIQGNRLILDKNGTCYGVLMNNYFAGTWNFEEADEREITHLDFPKQLDLKWKVRKEGFRKEHFEIEPKNLQQLNTLWNDEVEGSELTDLLDRQGTYDLLAEIEPSEFNGKDADPWSPELNKWRQAIGSRKFGRDKHTGAQSLAFHVQFFQFCDQA